MEDLAPGPNVNGPQWREKESLPPKSKALAAGFHLASSQLCALEPGPQPLCASDASYKMGT